jgi:hypothetical protein
MTCEGKHHWRARPAVDHAADRVVVLEGSRALTDRNRFSLRKWTEGLEQEDLAGAVGTDFHAIR